MAYETYEDFSTEMTEILSSGSVFEMSDWHETSIAELFSGMDRDCVIDFVNRWYASQNAEELRDGELATVADLIRQLDPSRGHVKANVRIVFE